MPVERVNNCISKLVSCPGRNLPQRTKFTQGRIVPAAEEVLQVEFAFAMPQQYKPPRFAQTEMETQIREGIELNIVFSQK